MPNELSKRDDDDKPTAIEKFNAKKVVENLADLMDRVTKENCTPDTVNAACNCAGRIADILRIHLEAERMKRRYRE